MLDNAMTQLPTRFAGLPSVLFAYAFPRWKWPVIRQCFPGCSIVFLKYGVTVPSAAWLLLWGKAELPMGANADTRVLRIEDGFLRSVGLGADLVKPLSWVVDGGGIHYDATSSSDLEVILSTYAFDDIQCARAARLRAQIVASRLTKYNVGRNVWHRPDSVNYVILVPGQVESDASLTYGAPAEHSNMGLLRSVRAANPKAYVVYKPHPDVTARLRKVGVNEQRAIDWCDEVLIDVSMGDLLTQVDEVHVMTSLSGFEALLHGKSVTCYGQPFYAGWGLTQDLVPHPRRQRQLTLDALVAGALIEYPLYLSRDGKGLISPEAALDNLLKWRISKGANAPWWQEIYRFFLRIFVGVM